MTISQCNCRCFIDYMNFLESWNCCCISNRLSLRKIETIRNCNHHLLDFFLACKRFCIIFQFLKQHCYNLKCVKSSFLIMDINNNDWFIILALFYFKWPKLNIILNLIWAILFSKQSFDAKYSICILTHSFSYITKQSLFVSESNESFWSQLSLIIWNNLYIII